MLSDEERRVKLQGGKEVESKSRNEELQEREKELEVRERIEGEDERTRRGR